MCEWGDEGTSKETSNYYTTQAERNCDNFHLKKEPQRTTKKLRLYHFLRDLVLVVLELRKKEPANPCSSLSLGRRAKGKVHVLPPCSLSPWKGNLVGMQIWGVMLILFP